MTEPLLTLAEVSELLKLSPDSVRRSVRHGRLRASKLGGRLRFRSIDVDAYIDAQQITPHPGPRRQAGTISHVPPSRVPPRSNQPGSFKDRAKKIAQERKAA